jgi:hypothetical protein
MKKAIFNASLIVLVKAAANDEQALEIFKHTLTDQGYEFKGETSVKEKIVSFDGEIHQHKISHIDVVGFTGRILAANKIRRSYINNTDHFQVQKAEVSFSCYEETGNIADIPKIADVPVVDPANVKSVTNFVEALGNSFIEGINAVTPKEMPEYPPVISGTPGEHSDEFLESIRVLSESVEEIKEESKAMPAHNGSEVFGDYRAGVDTAAQSPDTGNITEDRSATDTISPADL